MVDPEWSDEHVTRANRFTLHVVLAWIGLVTLQAILPRSSVSLLLGGVAALGATWLLAHSLFTQVDGLVKTRVEEAGSD